MSVRWIQLINAMKTFKSISLLALYLFGSKFVSRQLKYNGTGNNPSFP